MTGRPHHRVVGYDAWQAMTLAVRLVDPLLTYFVEDGGSLLCDGGYISTAVSDIVPRTSMSGPHRADLVD
jgi:hypothetical protein